MAKQTINRQQLILEFVFIVFAVLLALLLNSWRESMATAKAVDKVKQSIRTELINNDEQILKVNDYRINLIRELRSGTHLITRIPIANYPVDVNDDQALESYLKRTLPFSRSTVLTKIEILRNEDERVLTLNERYMRMVVENDTLKLYGVGNLQLRTAAISNRSWEIAQATGIAVEMDLELVVALNSVYNLNNEYLDTSDKAIEMIYRGESGITSVMEDMVYFEREILKADSVVLELLK